MSQRGVFHLSNIMPMIDAGKEMGIEVKVVTPPKELTADGKHRIPAGQAEVKVDINKENLLEFWAGVERKRTP